jgi:O-Antigen ligase
MSSNARAVSIRGGTITSERSGLAAAIFVLPAVATVLLFAQNQETAWAAVAVGVYCVCLTIVPTFWMAVVLVVLIPFQNLITGLLGGYGSNTRQAFAAWKEVLLLIGIVRCFYSNANRREIVAANRWVLFWCGFLTLAYCFAFLRAPSIAAFFALNIEIRFVGVLLFFMFLSLDNEQTVILLRLMICSVGLLALYGLIQYFWDYERLMPLVSSELISPDSQKRLYSYSLSFLESAYAPVIAILILLSGAARYSLRIALWWCALLFPCLVLTFTRSAYLGLLAGVATLCVLDRTQLRRMAITGVVATCVLCAILLFGGDAAGGSSFGQRVQSIVSQNDESSLEHKRLMHEAVQVISENPLGIGLGRFGPLAARFAGVDKAQYTENWELQVAIGAGIIAALAFTGLTATIFWSLFRGRCRENHSVALVTAAVTTFAAMTLSSMMIPLWFGEIPVVYAWALVGIALATCRGERLAFL